VKPSHAALALAGLALAAAVDLAVRDLPGPVRLEVGGFTGPLLEGEWTPPHRALYPDDVHPSVVADGLTGFYYRSFEERAALRLPLVSRGDEVSLTLRADGGVRSVLRVYVQGRPAGEALIPPGPWEPHVARLATAPGAELELGLALRPAPLVRGDHVEELWLAVDRVDVASDQGFGLTRAARLGIAAVPLLLLGFGLATGAGGRAALGLAAGGAVVAALLVRIGPVPVALAAPRLVPLALVAGLAALALGRVARGVTRPERAGLAALVAAGTLAHGALAFFPNHNPPDLDTHAVRTLDLARTPWTRAGLMRYGSHLPTVSQTAAPATDLFGERALLPYSPLPYFLYYGLHALGLDPSWAMTAVTAGLAMLVAPLMWLVARHVWGPAASWLAALLYACDLPVWHHLGRAHLPASFGNALGVAALLVLVWKADRLDAPRRVLAGAAVLALGTLGYTSLALLIGLFGLVLFGLLMLDAHALPRRARLGLVTAFVCGGLLAGAVYYFHYLPGLVSHADTLESEAPDLFDPYRFLIFRNESRQSMRIWRIGSWWLVGAGLLAAPLALHRARATARPLLTAWLLTWAGFMILKDPLLFPRLLRWTKEEQFLSPLMDLLVAGAVASLPRPWMRRAGALIALAWAFRLAVRDFLLHANSLVL
jgi:hypothetical protein